ncbi:hypothetical protein [Leptolyngbya sp. BC1307]|uniref:hypothetical protein n=1 Tax=Leptolyngbya sp. BC1307 TaxID=2029589 RepID=UPI001140DA55|nr:hypothetical protein [Leptolyngbya sp. BC1307]
MKRCQKHDARSHQIYRHYVKQQRSGLIFGIAFIVTALKERSRRRRLVRSPQQATAVDKTGHDDD